MVFLVFSFDVGTGSSSLLTEGGQGPPPEKESDGDRVGGPLPSNAGLGRCASRSEGVPAACLGSEVGGREGCG